MPNELEQELKELKAEAYDHLALIEHHQKKVSAINQKIAEMTQKLMQEKNIPVKNENDQP